MMERGRRAELDKGKLLGHRSDGGNNKNKNRMKSAPPDGGGGDVGAGLSRDVRITGGFQGATATPGGFGNLKKPTGLKEEMEPWRGKEKSEANW